MRTSGTVPTADGTRLAYQLDGAGPPLLLLAGQANHHGWWDQVRPDFAAFRTITLDWRGTGDSEDGVVDFTTRTLAGDVVDVLDAVGYATVDVYGTSMGGRVAQWLAVDHPERVSRLVLGCTTPGGEQAVERSQEVRRRLASPTATRCARP
jgi:3-oxoadipate enol-lactonase